MYSAESDGLIRGYVASDICNVTQNIRKMEMKIAKRQKTTIHQV